jgi:flagellar biosynthetic protein FliQ
MNPQDAIDFSREAIKTCLMVGGPILAASLLIGLLLGVFQAMTQVQDQTVSFVPKILLLLVMIGLCLPWLSDQMLDFAKTSFEKPMTQWAGVSQPSLFPADNRQTPADVIAHSRILPGPPTLSNDHDTNDNPFMLPHYRISKSPKSDIGG